MSLGAETSSLHRIRKLLEHTETVHRQQVEEVGRLLRLMGDELVTAARQMQRDGVEAVVIHTPPQVPAMTASRFVQQIVAALESGESGV